MFLIGLNKIDIEHAKVAIDSLRKVNANIIGVIVNKFEVDESTYCAYQYYYGDDENIKNVMNLKNYFLLNKIICN